ncbi:MAG: prolipoprotein diacylglyceryl transferase [Candidatus Absconditabacteria bacterium]|nr:prolipoprotein diacylglyceryl transferase [Candidatus Absconditabacteria bacterium]MDD3868359.1 prolipoprotein diacylglyceryl transferase [Candidatus Absconditabacteria bacterium]MDD4714440.1 prolipoprotein diacylglyceryl transferase [Candidatus Absconditabacteria bacterium]
MMVAFQIFGWDIYWYGIFYLVGFLFGYLVLRFVGKRGYFKKFSGLQTVLASRLEDLMIFLVLGVLIGGRLGHIFIYDFSSFIGNWGEMFAVWNGGMSFIGGIVGVCTAMFIFKYWTRLSRKEFLILFDIILVAVPVGIFFGRLGNYLNQELYGIIFTNSLGFSEYTVSFLQSLNFLHVYPNIDAALRINTNQFSMVFEGVFLFILSIFLFFSQIKKTSYRVGLISSCFVLGYGIIRFFLEYLRNDSQAEFIGYFSKSQRFFLFFIFFGIVLFIWVLKQKPERL